MTPGRKTGDDDLDFGDGGDDASLPEVPDETGEDLNLGEPRPDGPIELVPDDGATTDLSGLEPEDGSADDALAVLEWSCEAVILELGARLPATLETGLPRSIWYTDRSDVPDVLTVAIGAVRGAVRFVVVPASEERIALGRDFLADRALVRS